MLLSNTEDDDGIRNVILFARSQAIVDPAMVSIAHGSISFGRLLRFVLDAVQLELLSQGFC